jgi:predicted enzyme related to lactoylglutathione lyase
MADATIGSFLWYDLLTADPAAAVSFYSHVVGWESQTFGQEYTLFTSKQGGVGGTAQLPDRDKKVGAPPRWVSNVMVADADATVSEAKKLGGRAISEPADYPNVGRLGVIADPQGGIINIFKPARPMNAHDSSRPGEFTWSELLTVDHEAALGFYGTLFGWKKQRDFDMGAMGKYLIFGMGDRDMGGMFTKPKDMHAPPHWLYYVQVADLDAAISRAKAKQAKLLNGPIAVPGGARVAQLMDPQGAGFALQEMPKG